MNGRLSKKLRKYMKKSWLEYLHQVKQWPFSARWRLAWWIVFGKE